METHNFMGVPEASAWASPRLPIEARKVAYEHIPGTFHPLEAFPGRLTLEGSIPLDVAEELRRRGRDVRLGPDWSAGYIRAVSRGGAGLLEAGADPRGRTGSVSPSRASALQAGKKLYLCVRNKQQMWYVYASSRVRPVNAEQ